MPSIAQPTSRIKIVQIDGNRLTRLMLGAGVGVSVKDTYRVHRIDEVFFAEFEE